MRRRKSVKIMCRHYASKDYRPLAAGYWPEASASMLALVAIATLLSACSSAPSAPEQKPQAVASASKSEKTAATETAAAPAEAPIPPEAVQQFDSAVAL